MNKNLKKGIELIKQVENSAAISYLKKALESDPQNPEIYRHLGLASFNLGQYEKALSYWTKAVELAPTNHQTLWNLGNLHEMEKRFDKAFEAYQQAATVAEKSSDLKKAKRYKEWAAKVKQSENEI
ncbi:MAG: tetratricopeptide repeat protein [Candidatus Heimdallarchaeota archaeon]|nr:MAG: tetratricopeptide repeat protein [Candidatus Heimdallarchaeota archaeon]